MQKSANLSEPSTPKPSSAVEREKGAPPGRGSIMWDVITDITLAPLVASVGIMQGALPAVSAGVEKTGAYKYDMLERARGSAASLARFLYDGENKAYHEASDLRKMHANIKGTLDDGTPYFALNPTTYRIVPDTLLDAVIRIREFLGKPLSDKELDTLYIEYTQLCLMLGIPRKYIPETLEQFHINYLNTVENELQLTSAVKFLLGDKVDKDTENNTSEQKPVADLSPKLAKGHTQKKSKSVREKISTKLYTKASPLLSLGTRSCLHPRYTEIHDVHWSEEDQQSFEKLISKILFIHKIVPRALRYRPMVFRLMLGFHGPKLITAEEVAARETKNKIRQDKKIRQKTEQLSD